MAKRHGKTPEWPVRTAVEPVGAPEAAPEPLGQATESVPEPAPIERRSVGAPLLRALMAYNKFLIACDYHPDDVIAHGETFRVAIDEAVDALAERLR
jgi:hypothetical protein